MASLRARFYKTAPPLCPQRAGRQHGRRCEESPRARRAWTAEIYCANKSSTGRLSHWRHICRMARRGGCPPIRCFICMAEYMVSSPTTHRHMVQQLCHLANMRALVIDYRLAPESRFRQRLRMPSKASRWLLAQGIDPSNCSSPETVPAAA